MNDVPRFQPVISNGPEGEAKGTAREPKATKMGQNFRLENISGFGSSPWNCPEAEEKADSVLWCYVVKETPSLADDSLRLPSPQAS